MSTTIFRFLKRWAARAGWVFVGWMASFLSALYASKGGMKIKGTDQIPLPETGETS